MAIAQLDLPAGAADANRERLIDAIRSAAGDGADLIVLPELASSVIRSSRR